MLIQYYITFRYMCYLYNNVIFKNQYYLNVKYFAACAICVWHARLFNIDKY